MVLRESIHTASEEHDEDSSEWLYNFNYRADLTLTFSEWRTIAELKANNWKIQKGQIYINQVGVWDGDFYEVKILPEMHKLCLKYDLYPEE